MVLLLLSGCTDEKDKKIAELNKKVEELAKLREEQVKQKEQDVTKQDMALQKQCAEDAQQYYNKIAFDVRGSHNYTNHYNKKHNKCYILGVETINGTASKTLTDISENKDIGYYLMMNNKLAECWVNDSKCNSESVYEFYVKPYMEE